MLSLPPPPPPPPPTERNIDRRDFQISGAKLKNIIIAYYPPPPFFLLMYVCVCVCVCVLEMLRETMYSKMHNKNSRKYFKSKR